MTRKVFPFVSLLAAGFCAAAPIAGPKADWRFAHPKPDVLISVNVGAIARSPFLAQNLNLRMPSDADRAKIEMALKMAATVDRVQVSVRTVPGTKDADVLVLVTGELDGLLRMFLTQPQASGGMVSRQISPNTLLLGKAHTLDLAAKRMTGVAEPAIADELASSDIWISGDISSLPASAKAGAPPGLDTLKRFSLGMSFGDPVELNLNMGMQDDAAAQKLVGLIRMLMMQARDTPEAAELADATKIERQGSQIHVHFAETAAQVQASLAKVQALRAGAADSAAAAQFPGLLGTGLAGIFGVGSPAESRQAAPQNPGKIMIYGLDDGPREVGSPRKLD